MAGRGRPQRGTVDDHLLVEDHPLVLALAAGLWALGLSLFLALAIPVQADRVQALDDSVWRWAVEAEWAPLVTVAKVLDFLGSTWATTPMMAAIAVLLVWRRRWKTLTFWVLAMVGSQLLIGPIKSLYERERPPLALVSTSGFSFPSGHAVVTAAIAIALVIVFVPAGPRRRNFELIAAALAVVMAASRVYLRAHWSTDTIAGAALGAAVVILTATVVSEVATRMKARRAPPG